jgi:hypothetical protein
MVSIINHPLKPVFTLLRHPGFPGFKPFLILTQNLGLFLDPCVGHRLARKFWAGLLFKTFGVIDANAFIARL